MESASCTQQSNTGLGSRHSRRWLGVLGLIVALGAVLRFWNIGAQSLWFDEGYSAWVIGLSPGRIVEVIRNDASPPLYYLLVKLWSEAFGDSEAALRSLSAVAAVVSLMVVPAITWRLTRNGLATVTTACVYALSVLQIQYAQEARSYGLASLLAAIAVYSAVRRMEGSRWWLAGIIGSCLASVYLHNMMWFYVAGLFFSYVVWPGKVSFAKRVGELGLVGLVIVAGYAVWIPALLGQMAWLKGNFWATVPTVDALAGVLAAVGGIKLMHLGAFMQHPRGIAAGVLVAMVIVSLLGQTRDDLRRALAMLGYGVLPVLAVFVHAQYSQSFFVEKVFTASTLVLPVLAGLAVVGRARYVSLALVGLLMIGSGVSVYGQLYVEKKEQWREAAAHVNSFEREGTLVVFVANEGELLHDYYTRRAGVRAHEMTGVPQGFRDIEPPRTIQRVRDASDTDRFAKLLDERKPQRVLLVYAHWEYSDPAELTRALLESRMELVEIKGFHWVNVLEYRSTATQPVR